MVLMALGLEMRNGASIAADPTLTSVWTPEGILYFWRVTFGAPLAKCAIGYVARRSRRCRIVLAGSDPKTFHMLCPIRGLHQITNCLKRMSLCQGAWRFHRQLVFHSSLPVSLCLCGIISLFALVSRRTCQRSFLLREAGLRRVDLFLGIPSGPAGDPSQKPLP